MMTLHGPLKPKLSDAVRRTLIDMIGQGALRPGDALPSERELMARLGSGRPAIREAMQDLERSGLIVIRHGGRARVAEPALGRMVDQMSDAMRHLLSHNAASLENLKEARATFEAEMARQAARKRSAQGIERLEEILAEQNAAVTDGTRFRALDGRFHREIAGISGNPIWLAVSDGMFRWLSDFHVTLVSFPGLEALTLAEHRGILDAIRAGSPDRAAQAMTEHLFRANALYRQKPVTRP
jgi:GntR family transcriptional regulator, sialic acid-inducible nan operon repressor